MHHETYQFNRDGKLELVTPEPWRWRVIYRDGSELRQFDDDTRSFHQFSEIDHAQAMRFIMEHDTQPASIHELPAGAKLIHFYKNFIISAGSPEEVRVRLYCFGYESDSGNKYMVISPDNQISVVPNFESVEVS